MAKAKRDRMLVARSQNCRWRPRNGLARIGCMVEDDRDGSGRVYGPCGGDTIMAERSQAMRRSTAHASVRCRGTSSDGASRAPAPQRFHVESLTGFAWGTGKRSPWRNCRPAQSVGTNHGIEWATVAAILGATSGALSAEPAPGINLRPVSSRGHSAPNHPSLPPQKRGPH